MKKILGIAIVSLCAVSLAACGSKGAENKTATTPSPKVEKAVDKTSDVSSSDDDDYDYDDTTDNSSDDTTASSSDESVPTEYKSALTTAKEYSDQQHMSKAGLYEQLTSDAGEKFSAEAGQYAIDNLKADYNANALATAKDYQEQQNMSPESIREQLTSDAGEKFTPDEANYAIQHLND
ncbi:Ltp family lipoprotein [Latilactobacillus sakei]|uniref:Ltp family lipoprotein n=1 Tax=Latilactobacillus sakei TaxID=1599 RepID=UPI003889D0AC